MGTQLLIKMDAEIKDRLARLARAEGKTASQVVRDLIAGYVRERDVAGYVDDLWERIGGTLRAKKLKPGDVAAVVRRARRDRTRE